MKTPRTCITIGCANLTRTPPRCPPCETAHQHHRNTTRPHYQGNYRTRARATTTNATHCWLCGQGPRTNDPFQADHIRPGDPTSPLQPAHRTCNARRGNRTQ